MIMTKNKNEDIFTYRLVLAIIDSILVDFYKHYRRLSNGWGFFYLKLA